MDQATNTHGPSQRAPAEPSGAARTRGLTLVVVLLVLAGGALPLSFYLGLITLPLLLVGLALLAVSGYSLRPERVHVRTWAFYIGAIYFYDYLRSFADDTPLASHLFLAVNVETSIFGVAPTVWLQERLFSVSSLSFLDFFSVGIHWSFFIVPHVAAAAVYVLRPQHFLRYALLIVTTFYLGLVLYFLLPSAPPWLAAEWGFLPGVARIIDFVGGQVDPVTYSRMYDALGTPNAIAAMPSVHMAVTFSVYLFWRNTNRAVAWAALAYAAFMGFALVYLGEHYLIDVVAGILIAAAAHYLVRRVMRARERREAPSRLIPGRAP